MDLDRAIDAHARAAEQFVRLVESLPTEPIAVPPLEWNSSEVAAHVLSAYRAYARAATVGVPIWPSKNGVDGNQNLLDATPERDPAVLGPAIAEAGDTMRAALVAAAPPIAAFGDVTASAPALLAVNTLDTLVHGFDISTVRGTPWAIDVADAALGLEGLVEIMPAFIRPDSTLVASYGLSLRNGQSWTFHFDDGTLTIEPRRPMRADCRISADATAWLLSSYGRMSPARALLTGRVVAYGRRPWLAPRLGDQFDPP